jgi:hypothetical protein
MRHAAKSLPPVAQAHTLRQKASLLVDVRPRVHCTKLASQQLLHTVSDVEDPRWYMNSFRGLQIVWPGRVDGRFGVKTILRATFIPAVYAAHSRLPVAQGSRKHTSARRRIFGLQGRATLLEQRLVELDPFAEVQLIVPDLVLAARGADIQTPCHHQVDEGTMKWLAGTYMLSWYPG